MKDAGNAVVSALLSITFSTLLTLSILSLGLSAMNTMLIRDAAITAASRQALSEARPQQEYLMRMLENNLPHLANFEVDEISREGLVGYSVAARLPGLGLWQPQWGRVSVFAAKERIL